MCVTSPQHPRAIPPATCRPCSLRTLRPEFAYGAAHSGCKVRYKEHLQRSVCVRHWGKELWWKWKCDASSEGRLFFNRLFPVTFFVPWESSSEEGRWSPQHFEAGRTRSQHSWPLISPSSLSWQVSYHLPGDFSPPNLHRVVNWARWGLLSRVKWLLGAIEVRILQLRSPVPACIRGPDYLLSFRKSYECRECKGGTSEGSWHWPNSVLFEVEGALPLISLEAKRSRHQALPSSWRR